MPTYDHRHDAPLCWPRNLPRTHRPVAGSWRGNPSAARQGVIRSLSALTDTTGEYVTDIVLSSNIETFTAVPDDGGAAAWFVWSGAMRCVAIDLYRRPSDNFIAVSRVIKALERTMARGGFQAVNQALQAFTPPPFKYGDGGSYLA